MKRNEFITVNIKQPLYSTDEGDTVCVYDKYINDAIRDKKFLVVISKNGEATFKPKWVQKYCEIMEKVFLRPDEPMRLYKIFIKRRQTKEERSEEITRLAMR